MKALNPVILIFDIKHCLDFFLCIFSSLICLKKTCFQQAGFFCGGRYQPGLYWDLLTDQWKVPSSLSLFLKCENIPALLHVGKGPE
jgi:hypothetical protein